MKITKYKLILLLILTLPILFLTACDDADLDLIGLVIEAWAEENGLYKDGKFSPYPMAQKAAEDTIGGITNKEPFIQLDGLDVIRDIETADKLASEALVDFDTSKISSAVSIRPLDWRLHEQEGAVWLANQNSAAAESAYAQSDELLQESLLNGGNCLALRRSQLQTRLGTLWEAVKTYESQSGKKQGDARHLRDMHKFVGEELSDINTHNESDFCGVGGNN
ncbi:MAG: hypothetical protein HQ574_09225 [Chloroflexi bacterium]|nr:hypothetical protein [Chloroflexota bacterium]